jgi:hypothetical protein
MDSSNTLKEELDIKNNEDLNPKVKALMDLRIKNLQENNP